MADGFNVYDRTSTPFDRIAAQIEFRDDGCWAVPRKGGARPYMQQNRRRVLAYRVLWEAVVGPIPDGLTLDHLCRNPSCVNPDHLEPVTPGENARRNKGHINLNEDRCRAGLHPWAGDNIAVKPSGARYCRECHKQGCRVRDTARRSTVGV